MKILMVCLGNICRSPMAEGIMRNKIEQNKLPWQVSSAGTIAYHTGNPPDSRAQKELRKHNINIENQRARKFNPYMFEQFDMICAMDASNYIDILNLAETDKEKQKVHMIMNMAEPGKNIPVPDPYYDDKLYPVVYEMLDKACDIIIKKYAATILTAD